MKLKLLKVLIPCALLAISGMAQSALITASAVLDYAQEVSPSNTTPSTATGTATVIFDTVTGLLDLSAEITGITLSDVTFPTGPLAFDAAGPFHIHQGAAGANGPIVVPFSSASFFSDTATGLAISATGVGFDAALIAPLVAGELYLNLHSLEYASGEIRGQLAVPEPGVTALLSVVLFALFLSRRRRLQ